MSFTMSSGQTSVTGTVTSTQSIQQATFIAGSVNAGNDVTLGTVGAGKKWYIISCSAGVGVTNTAVNNYYEIQVNSVAIFTLAISCGATSENAFSSSSQTWNLEACPQATAGQTVVMHPSATGAGVGRFVVGYVEVSV